MSIDTGNVEAKIDTLALINNSTMAPSAGDAGNLAALLSSPYLNNSSALSGERVVVKLLEWPY
jgi:hypothetical protein